MFRSSKTMSLLLFGTSTFIKPHCLVVIKRLFADLERTLVAQTSALARKTKEASRQHFEKCWLCNPLPSKGKQSTIQSFAQSNPWLALVNMSAISIYYYMHNL